MQLQSNSTSIRRRLNDWKTIRVELFDGLVEAVAYEDVEHDEWQQQLDGWQEFFESQPQSAKLLFELQTAKALLWCASVAATNQGAVNPEVLEACLVSCPQDTAEFISDNQGWALDSMQRLAKKGVTQRSISIPVALCPNASLDGKVARLVLELTSGGDGQIFQHPCDTLMTYAHGDFTQAIADAWQAACHLLAGEGKACNFNTLWRVLDAEGHPLEEVEGRSASAAALLGFYHLLNGTRPDKGIIVLAQIDEQNICQLKDVGRIYEKTSAVIQHGGFDLILVADEDDRTEVEKAIARANQNALHQQPLPVCQLISFETLTSVRSKLVQEVMDYLDALAKRAAELPAYYPAHLHSDKERKTPFDDLRQMVQIVEERSLFHEWLAKERERMKAAGLKDDTKAYNPLRARPETAENDEKEPQTLMPNLPIQWDEKAGGQFKRAVILADPGFGKTWLLRYEARRIARQSLKALREYRNHPDEIEFPILARLSEVNRSDNPVEDALIHLIVNGYSDRFRRYVAGKLNTDKCVVLLDAWDEVPEEKPKAGKPIKYKKHRRQRLGQRLAEFAQGYKHLRLLMTSRIVNYGVSPIPEAEELEIISFDTPQIESFARVWFGKHLSAKVGFLDMLRRNQAVRGLARIPLMLALVCRVYEAGAQTFPARRVELYERCLRGLLKDWREEKDCFSSDSQVDAFLEMLAPVSLALFREGYEQFSESILRPKVIDWLKQAPEYHELREEKPSLLIDALKYSGIFISAGDYRDAPLLFLHRTFHEYLAASELAQRANKEGWDTIAKLIDKKAWDSEWQEVIILLAGMVDNPLPLLELLMDKSSDDYFRHRLALAARCLGEINPETRNKHIEIVDSITSEAVLLWWSHKADDTESCVEHLAKTFPVLGRINGRVDEVYLLDWVYIQLNELYPSECLDIIIEIGAAAATDRILSRLAGLLKDEEQNMRHSVVKTIGELGAAAATDRILSRLIELLKDEDEDVRDSVVEVISRIGAVAATDRILSRLADLLKDEDEDVRGSAASVIAKIGAAAATDIVLSRIAGLLQDENNTVRRSAVEAIGNIGAAAATDIVLSRIAGLLKAADWYVRNSAAEAIGELKTIAASAAFLSRLAGLLKDEDWQVRSSAASAIGKIGAAAATDIILSRLGDLLKDEDWYVRNSAAEAIGKIGAAAATDIILSRLAGLLKDEDWQVRSSAAEAIGKIGAAAATDIVLSRIAGLLQDENNTVRRSAVEAIGNIGAAAATPRFLSRLADLFTNIKENVRRSAVAAIGNIGAAAATPAILSRLIILLKEGKIGVRRSAAEAIGKIGAAAATDIILSRLAGLLKDEDWQVRNSAAEAIGKIGAAAATDIVLSRLAGLLKDEDWQTYYSAIEAIGGIGTAAATDIILSRLANFLICDDWRIRSLAADALRQMHAVQLRFFLDGKGKLQARSVTELSA